MGASRWRPRARPRRRCRRAREARGALAVESVEPEFAFDRRGPRRRGGGRREQTESHRLIEHLMIAANEAVADAARRARRSRRSTASTSARSRARVERLVDAARVARRRRRRRVPEHAVAAAGGRARRARSRARRPARAPHRPRPRGADLARPALAQAGALRAAQPRPRRPALAALLPLHVADPPLPGPGLPPRAAGGDRRRARTRRARRALEEAAEWTLGARARRDGRSSATPTTSRAASCSSASCSSAAGTREFDGEVIGRHRRGRVRRLRRRLRGDAAGAAPARRLVGAQRAGDDARSGRAVRRGDPARRPGAGRGAQVDAPRGRVDLDLVGIPES